ncbi:HIT family protein [Actinomadura roseirufa]|uniref:HIT family protein n=1 Tax=Actinomadura roseirufa TaxID=2094049 RepID=UPI00104174E0|nr:HIT domain-containing protein [Actinomadura roseirufa]
MTAVPDCLSCEHEARWESLPPRDRIARDAHWRLSHAFGTDLPGWLVLVPRRHVTSVAELTDAEAAALGDWQVRSSRALQAVVGCVKTYVAQFAEAEGFAHVHFHIVPRMGDLAEEFRGPRVFGLLGRDGVAPAHRDELAVELRRWLEAARPDPD